MEALRKIIYLLHSLQIRNLPHDAGHGSFMWAKDLMIKFVLSENKVQ
jgi:hypothetical protein